MLSVGALLAVWIAFDLYTPHKVEICDTIVETLGGVTEEDWQKIDELLHES